MASKLAIKNRIKSVDSTKKITKAMQLVAASKLRRCKQHMSENSEYAKYLTETVNSILSSLDNLQHPYLQKNDNPKTLKIVFTSDMGLCGAYNANIFKILKNDAEDNEYIMIGNRGVTWLNHQNYNVVNTYINIDEEGYEDIAAIALDALARYSQKKIGKIEVVYTKFVNAVTFEPTIKQLLPIEKQDNAKTSNVEMICEPDGTQILDDLVPLYLKSVLYSYWLETKTSEQASRQTAMENATNNGEELRNSLELEFNKARQSAITQEITEIVAGANALS